MPFYTFARLRTTHDVRRRSSLEASHPFPIFPLSTTLPTPPFPMPLTHPMPPPPHTPVYHMPPSPLSPQLPAFLPTFYKVGTWKKVGGRDRFWRNGWRRKICGFGEAGLAGSVAWRDNNLYSTSLHTLTLMTMPARNLRQIRQSRNLLTFTSSSTQSSHALLLSSHLYLFSHHLFVVRYGLWRSFRWQHRIRTRWRGRKRCCWARAPLWRAPVCLDYTAVPYSVHATS